MGGGRSVDEGRGKMNLGNQGVMKTYDSAHRDAQELG